MSVALFDLKCPSYDYVRRMTWAEFRLRLHGLARDNERRLIEMREMAWVTYIAPHSDPKKMAKTKEKFWPIKKKAPKVELKRRREAMERAMKEYLKNKKDG